jgi:hypothetical protein
MSRFGAAILTILMFAATPHIPSASAAEEAPHKIARDSAWGCREKSDVIDLLFLGLSTTFDTTLANALADGRCVFFNAGEVVLIVDPAANGLVKVARPDEASAVYWMPARNVR